MENQGSEGRAPSASSSAMAASGGQEEGEDEIQLAEYDLMDEDELPAEDYLLAIDDLDEPSVGPPSVDGSERVDSAATLSAPPAIPPAMCAPRLPPQPDRGSARPGFFHRLREIWGSPHPVQR